MLGRESPMRGIESLQAHAGLAPHVVLLIGAEGEPILNGRPYGWIPQRRFSTLAGGSSPSGD